MARFKSTITDKGAEVLTRFLAQGRQITLIRAAFEVLQHPELAEIWNEADAKLTEITKAALESEKNGKPAIFAEEK